MCLSVCLSAAARPHYCTDPDVTWERGRVCPLVVHYSADLQSVHMLHCHGNITRTLVTSFVHPAIWRHSANARRGLRALLADDWRVTGGCSQNFAPYMGSGRGWLAGDWPSTGAFSTLLRRPGLRASHWWRSGNITRTQNVSEYMLVLALCLASYCMSLCAFWFLSILSAFLFCLAVTCLCILWI